MPEPESADTKYRKREKVRKSQAKQTHKLEHKRFVRKLKTERYFARKADQPGILSSLKELLSITVGKE